MVQPKILDSLWLWCESNAVGVPFPLGATYCVPRDRKMEIRQKQMNNEKNRKSNLTDSQRMNKMTISVPRRTNKMRAFCFCSFFFHFQCGTLALPVMPLGSRTTRKDNENCEKDNGRGESRANQNTKYSVLSFTDPDVDHHNIYYYYYTRCFRTTSGWVSISFPLNMYILERSVWHHVR